MAKKIECEACGEKVIVAELAFNEAEHEHNVCSDCATTIEEDVKEKKIASLIKKGIDAKTAKKKVANLDLEPLVLKAVVKLIQEEEGASDDDEVEDIDLKSDDDEDETEIATEVAARKPSKKDKKVVAAPAPVVAPAKTKKEKVVAAPALSPRQQKLADRAARKAAKEAAAAAPVKPVKPGKTPAAPVKELSARQIKLAARAARKAAKENGTAVAPAAATAKPAKSGKEVSTDIIIAMSQDRVEKFVRLATKAAKEAMLSMKIKKGVDASEILEERITEEFNTRLSAAFIKDFKAAAKESGLSKTIRTQIAAAATA
jgi:DNA-directed RNA polymerase subunit RPC12/RpoP